MAIDNAAFAAIICKNGQWMADSATALWQTQWASAASAAQNEKEQAEYAKIANGSKYTLVQSGSSIALSESEITNSFFQPVIEEGMGTPLSGGHGGFVTEPDGSTRTSNVPYPLRGTPLPQYAKAPNPVSEGVQTMLQSLFPSWANETVADSKADIVQIIKPEIIARLNNSI